MPSRHKKDPRLEKRVQVTNPKHPNHGAMGKVTKMDRGNVTVTLDSGHEICTRWSCLTDASPDPFNDPEFG